MGKIRKILETELVGGTQNTDVYPVTSTKAVYDTDNKVLDNYIQHLKKTSTFAGIATPITNPGTPNGNVFYIAGEGTYINFSNLVIGVGQLGILKWDGTWSKQVLEIGAGGGSGGGGGVVDTATITKVVNDTIKNVSWWGQKINNNKVDGNIVITKGSRSFNIELDDNGNLKFNGNIYATGGITALGVGNTAGGESGGGSDVSLGTLLVQLNNENPLPTDNGQVLTYDGSNFIWKIPTGSGGGSSSGGSTTGTFYFGAPNKNLSFNGSNDVHLAFGDGLKVEKNYNQIIVSATGGGNDGSGVTLSAVMNAMNNQLGETTLNTPQFLYWNGSTYTWKNESEISGGSGSSGTTSGRLRFYKDSSEKSWNGESDFKIIFGSGLNVTWDSNSQITLSATGGSSTGGSVDLSNYLTKTEASTTYATKSHTHSADNIVNFASTVKGITVDNAKNAESVSWTDVTNKPSTFTPSSHTHSASDIIGKVNNATNADKATQLANSRTIWGQSFNGTSDINGNLKMGSAGGGSIQLWMNNDNMLERINNTLHIAYGLKESSNGEIDLDAYRTVVYTDNRSNHYDFKSNVFDVNSNQIHFGSETNGGKIYWDAANNAFKIEGNVYATGGITALGVSNNATTSNNFDVTFKSVTANTFNVMDSIQLSDKLKLTRDDNNIDLVSIDVEEHYLNLDGAAGNYYLSTKGEANFNSLSCITLNFGVVNDFRIINTNTTGFTIQFNCEGRTYNFTPSATSVTVS